MLTKEERDFIHYWETNREKENTFLNKMIFGGPWGLIFALPILVAVFFHDWYKRMVPVTKGQLILICLAVAAIAFFYAYFRQQVRWENNEQTYKALKLRQEQENLTNKSD